MTPVTQVVTVTTSGTPVPLPGLTGQGRIAVLYVQPLKTNTSDGYIGTAGMNRVTGVKLIKRITTDGEFALATADATSRIDPQQYVLDADAANQSFVVTYWCA